MKAEPFYDLYIGVQSDGELTSISSARITVPLGQLVIASAIQREVGRHVTCRVYNLEISAESEVRQDIEFLVRESSRPLAGMTLLAGNVAKSLNLAQWLSDLGCDVLLGGPDVTPTTASRYARSSAITGALVGPGERIVPRIVYRGLSLSPLPNLYTSFYQPHCVEPPDLDFGNITVDYNLLYGLSDHDGVSYIWGNDCHLRKKRCYFCGRMNFGIGYRDSIRVWNELRVPAATGIRRFYNTADSVAVRPGAFQSFVEARPVDLAKTSHKVFINATQVTEENAISLAKLNALATIGVESFSLLAAVGKGNTTVADNIRAIRILHENGVRMILTFVLGLPGETRSTLNATGEKLLQIVRDYGDCIDTVYLSPLLVLTGTRAFDDLEDVLGKIPLGSRGEAYDPIQATEAYFQQFCKLSRSEVVDYIRTLRNDINCLSRDIVIDSKGITTEEKRRILVSTPSFSTTLPVGEQTSVSITQGECSRDDSRMTGLTVGTVISVERKQ